LEGKVYVITAAEASPLFRLVGFHVVEVKNSEEAISKVKELIKDPEVAVILVSNDVVAGREEEVRDMSATISKPVITLIPGMKHKPPKIDPNKVLMRALGFG